MVRDPLRRLALVALGLLFVSCEGRARTAAAESGVRVHPFSEVQSEPVTFEADTSRPGRVLAHVRTKHDLICAFVWVSRRLWAGSTTPCR